MTWLSFAPPLQEIAPSCLLTAELSRLPPCWSSVSAIISSPWSQPNTVTRVSHFRYPFKHDLSKSWDRTHRSHYGCCQSRFRLFATSLVNRPRPIAKGTTPPILLTASQVQSACLLVGAFLFFFAFSYFFLFISFNSGYQTFSSTDHSSHNWNEKATLCNSERGL